MTASAGAPRFQGTDHLHNPVLKLRVSHALTANYANYYCCRCAAPALSADVTRVRGVPSAQKHRPHSDWHSCYLGSSLTYLSQPYMLLAA